jgi:hypothetical protein
LKFLRDSRDSKEAALMVKRLQVHLDAEDEFDLVWDQYCERLERQQAELKKAMEHLSKDRL